MKLKVVGWTYNDDYHFPESEGSSAAYAAVLDDIREYGYLFSGVEHQGYDYCTPVLNDGTMFSFSQRGWGGVIAKAYGDDDDMAYARFAFDIYEEGGSRKPEEERHIINLLHQAAREELGDEKCYYLFEGDYTIRYPQSDVPADEIYTLTEEEEEEIGTFSPIRQVPRVVMRRLFPEELQETYVLDPATCTVEINRVRTPMREDLRYLDSGDTVVVGDTSYLVKYVNETKDVPFDIATTVMFQLREGNEEAYEIYERAPLLLDIYF